MLFKKLKKKFLALIIVLAVILALIITIVIFGIVNGKKMNDTVEDGLNALRAGYTLTEVDPGEYKTIRVFGIMKFNTRQYEAEGLGNVSVMTVNMGVMQMSTLVITPYDKNMPMMSTDFMYMFTVRKALVEFYDLVEDKTDPAYTAVLDALRATADSFSDLDDTTVSEGWYDSLKTVFAYKAGSASDDDRINALLKDMITVYTAESAKLPALDADAAAAKLAVTQNYSDNMVEKGGVSTSVFKKALGDDTTRAFFETVFFGTKREN